MKEMKVTTFPSQTVVINFTVFVIAFTAVMALYLGALDVGFGDVMIEGINKVRGAGIFEAREQVVASSTVATSTPIVPTSATESIQNSIPVDLLNK